MGRPWSDVEPRFRRRWTERYSDRPWDRFLDRAQEIWDEVTSSPAPRHAGGASSLAIIGR